MRCVALKIKSGVVYSSADIINNHFKKQKEVGKVYYSTNVPFDTRREMEKVLFYFSHQGVIRYVLADIIKSEFNKSPFSPNDSCKYSPAQYQNMDKKSWLLLENMREVQEDYLDDCFVEYTNGTSKKLVQIINSQNRLNRVYFNKISENIEDDDDVLIK